MPEVDVFVGTGNFLDLPELLRRTEAPETRADSVRRARRICCRPRQSRASRPEISSPSYLKISEGCNHKCAFCIIPKIRGLHESRPIADLVAEARNLADGGVRELNLIAQDLTAYGRDLERRRRWRRCCASSRRSTDLRWIRLLYCYPNFVTAELLDTIAELPEGRQVYRYAAAACRRHDAACDAPRALRRRAGQAARTRFAREFPGVVLRTSFIVGFPGETDAAFGRLVDFVRENSSTAWACSPIRAKKILPRTICRTRCQSASSVTAGPR